MADPVGSISYDDPSRLEDVLDLVVNVSPNETPLGTMLGTQEATQTLHEWTEYYRSRPTSVSGVEEGADTSFVDLTHPARRNNITMIIEKPVRVSDTQRSVDHAGIDDAFEQQTAWEMSEWKKDQEWALINSAIASGSSGVARSMAGLINVITTLATQYASGASLAESTFNGLAQLSYEQVGGNHLFDMVLVGPRLKRAITNFASTANTGNRFYDVEDKRLTRAVSVYEGDFGVHRIFPHLDVPSGATSEILLGIREEDYKIAYLRGRRPSVERLSKVGDAERGRIVGEVTLEYLAERASVKGTFENAPAL